MLIDILNKFFYVLFFLSFVNVIRISFFLFGSFIKANDGNSEKFRLTARQLLLLGLSIAYLLSSIFNGVTI